MKSAVIFFYLFAIAGNVFAKEYFASAINEATAILKKAKAGDKVVLKNGTYRSAVMNFHNSNGTRDAGIIFAAETPGKVLFEGGSTLSFSGTYIVVEGFVWQHGGDSLGSKSVIEFKTGAGKNASHCTLQDCAIINFNTADKNIDNKWVSIYGQYNTVTRCLLKDKSNLGATLTVWLQPGEKVHHTISYNYFFGRQNGPEADNGLESIRIGDSKTSFEQAHCVVALNRFEACDGEIEIISNKSCNNSYLHNTFYNCDGGLTLRHGNNCLADGNYFDGGGKSLSYGVRFIGEGHVAVNNYFFNLKGAPNQMFRAPVTLVNGVVNTPVNGYFQVRRAVVASNIFVNCATPNIRVGATPNREGATLEPDTVSLFYNLFFDDAGNAGNVYQAISQPSHFMCDGNKVIGKYLTSGIGGFEILEVKGVVRKDAEWIKDSKGKLISGSMLKATLSADTSAGAGVVDTTILKTVKTKKYTYLSAKEVGPFWNRK